MGHIWVLSCLILLNIHLSLGEESSCTWSTATGTSYNFAPLDGVSWPVYENLTNGKEVFYSISVCSALTESGCSAQSAVCRNLDSGFVNVGQFASPLNITERNKELWLHLTGDACDSTSAGTGQKHVTTINFKCGKTLGTPILIDSYDCNAFFEWQTTVACNDYTATNEVPCYLYDNTHHRKYDLSPLVKTKGGHLVQSTSEDEFFINVCREINPDGASGTCPEGSGACQLTVNSVIDIGQPREPLKQTADGKLYLHYVNENPGVNCIGPASTTITFVCPTSRGQQSRPPPTLLATGQDDCQFSIEWHTEYACPEHTLVSDDCTLSRAVHGVDLDLSPLQQSPGSQHRYVATGLNEAGTKTYDYVMNICADAGVPCPTVVEGVAICQLDEGDVSFGRIMGRTQNSTLRYSDRDLTLTYSNGQICHNGFARTTVINFSCNQSAENEGRGKPVFNNEEDGCLYIFDWGTKYACVDVGLTCWIEQGDVRYDVSSLTRTDDNGSDWEASSSDRQESYFLNVCADIIGQEGTLSAQCPDGAAACVRTSDGSTKSLGKFATSIEIQDSGELQLHYTDGDICQNDQKYEALITLRCVSDHIRNSPKFTGKTGCVYKFEWETAAACHQGSHTGTDCRISNDGSGYSIDLSKLTKTGDAPYYQVSHGDYDYYINVCQDIGTAYCATTEDTTGNVGGCQVKKGSTGPTDTHVMGRANDNLVYYNGLINIHYTGGDKYSDLIHDRQMHINFMCNRSADVGQPEYLVETKHTYTFNWQTRYACPDEMMACSVVDEKTHTDYDLSGLVRMAPSSMWNALSGGHKFYVNICGSLSPNPLCDDGAAACATRLENAQENSWISNMGMARQPPHMDDNDQILLVYKNGGECVNDPNKDYSTHIHLECKQDGEPQMEFLETPDSDCLFRFVLRTSEACAPEDTSTSDENAAQCTVRDPTSAHVFNLSPLRKKSGSYQVSSTQHSFRLNVCGAIDSCDSINGKQAAVCDDSEPLASVSSDLQLSESGELTLLYMGKRDAAQNLANVIIKFKCNHSEPLGVPRFEGIDGHDYVFIWDTSLACEPAVVDCELTDAYGHLYNLGPLHKDQGNWHVTASSGDEYYINVCGPINPVDGVACPSGNIGACQLATNGPHSMGFIQSQPHASSNGTLTVRYFGGEGCHTGTEHESQRSTRIMFFCSLVQEGPVYVDETPECEYVFSWRTPAACPVTRVYGSECKVTEPLYDYVFDLSPLRKTDGSYQVVFEEYTYEFNVCGVLHGASGDCAQGNMASCQTKPGQEYNKPAGQLNQTLMYYNGVLHLTYLHGQGDCHGQYERSTVLTFTCDYSKTDASGLRYIKEEHSCAYRFEWATYHACPPREQSLCCISKDGKDYDLGELTLHDRNYQVEDPNSDKVYIINVCSNVVNQQGTTCPPNSAACIVDNAATGSDQRFIKIGDMSDQILTVVSDGAIFITSPTTEPCPQATGQFYSTVLNLTCPENGQSGQPHLMFVEGCSYHFRWDTHAACPVDHSTETASSAGNCEVLDPVSGELFDLKGWQSDEDYHVTDREGNDLWFGICGAAKTAQCSGDQIGSCRKTVQGSSYSAGKSNDKPIFDDGMVYLNYSGGDTCNNGLARNTLIYFIPSSPGSGYGQPVFIADDKDCTFHVAFYTEMIASNKKPWSCSTTDDHGHVFDLSPLTRSNNNHLALLLGDEEPDATYYISVCAPLAPIENVLCPPMSAACMLKAGQPPQSLGRTSGPPTFDTIRKESYLVYDHGNPCLEKPGTNISTKIIFTCETGPDMGEPYFIEKNDCQYVFNWGTNLLCHAPEPIQTTDCKFTDSQTGYTYDLSQLTKNQEDGHSYHVDGYYLNVCGGVVESAYRDSGCGDSPVCRVGAIHGVGYGSPGSQRFVMEGRDIKVSYTSSTEDASQHCKLSSHIIFKCDQTADGLGSPTLFMQSQCNVVFKWATLLACPPVVEECAIAHDHGTIDLRPLSRPVDSWIITDSNRNRYWLNLCQSVHQPVQSDICQSNAAACRQLLDGTVDMLGAVQTQRLYMDVDGETILMEYTQGSNACTSRRRSISGAATTQVRLTCGKTFGAPQIVPRKGDTDDCQFTFEWVTSVACKETRAPVTLTNGKLQDPETAAYLDYTSLVGTREMDLTDFVVRLGSDSVALDGCSGAAVCRKKNENNKPESIGDTATAKFYMEGDVLEVVLTSQTQCSTESGKLAKSIIDIQCDKYSDAKSTPMFVYASISCEYYFNWYTPSACLGEEVSARGTPVEPDSGSSHSHSSTAGAVVGIICAVIVIALLAVVFRKPERRIAFKNRLKSVFTRRGFSTQYSYAQLNSSDNSSLLGGASQSIPFQDDSDEDLIL